MTVKTKITLLITGAGLISGLIFSVAVFFELLEQPFDVIDAVLKEEAQYICRSLERARSGQSENGSGSELFVGHNYWVEVYDENMENLLFQSPMAHDVRMPKIGKGSRTVESIDTLYDGREVSKRFGSKTLFRARRMLVRHDESVYIVQIARPIVKLEKEIRELSIGVVVGFVFSVVVLVVISSFLSSLMLKPLGAMNELTQKVCDNNLGVRIPVGDSGDEFCEHARIVNTMLDRINNSFVRQRSFLFDTSHELKTPLASLRLVVDEINQMKDDKLPPLLLNSLNRMNTQILRMERLVKDLLKLASLEIVPTGDFHSVDMTGLMGTLMDDYLYVMEAHGIEVDVNLPADLYVHGDEKLLRRAFSNILDNAVKYNEPRGKIKVSAGLNSSEVSISIGNTGPGVAASELHSVFDQFYRGEKSRSIQYGGSGLGLAIVKRVIDIHGGTVRFESRENDWTNVTVILSSQKNV